MVSGTSKKKQPYQLLVKGFYKFSIVSVSGLFRVSMRSLCGFW